MPEMTFGIRVRDRRGELKWSQDELAAKTGVSQSQISKIETGEVSMPQRRTREAFARALGVSREWLEGVDEIPVDLDDLSEEEATIVGAWRTASPQGRALLLQAAEVVAGSAIESELPRPEAAEPPQQAPGPA